ncbi:TPA: hypothetical protein HA361_06150 [Candidatus Woesearchaeota archaeon]|nr:hypothetical protein [Candidatus Woesearchaeota archaeon]HII69096.1 hypothetical protein [Candidatus Woesearchaeota archaeon]
MESGLLAALSIIGLLALYWVLVGQWRYNRMMKAAEESDTKNAAGMNSNGKKK